MDPLVLSHVGPAIQMAMERLLYLLHQHRQHLENFNIHFDRLRHTLEDHVTVFILQSDKASSSPEEETRGPLDQGPLDQSPLDQSPMDQEEEELEQQPLQQQTHSVYEDRQALDFQLGHVNQHYAAIQQLNEGLHSSLTSLNDTCTALSWSLSVLYWSQLQQQQQQPY